MQTTIIYYTSNKETKNFERFIRRHLLEVIGDLPLISVSQKPIDFGHNICVGDVGVSNQNAHRQFQIGAKAAKTKFVHAVEADCLYPSDYFKFIPPRDDRCYRTPIWLMKLYGDRFYKKLFSESASVVGRDYIIDKIDQELKGRGEWQKELETGKDVPYTFPHQDFETFEINKPIINIKTKRGMHRWHGTVEEKRKLPYWGSPSDIRELYENECRLGQPFACIN